jgi:hypothetical protein
MINILRNCDIGICMYGAFETTASMVSKLFWQNRSKPWMTG